MSEEGQIPVNMEGWNWFDAAAKHAQTVTQEEKGITPEELKAHFETIFSTPAGKIVLEHLQIFVERQRDFDPDLGFYNGAAYGFWKSGQKSMVQYFKTMARGKQS